MELIRYKSTKRLSNTTKLNFKYKKNTIKYKKDMNNYDMHKIPELHTNP